MIAHQLYNQFFNSLGAILGTAQVVRDTDQLRAAEQSTFETSQRIQAIIFPRSSLEVQVVLQRAGEFGVPVYPISRGCNWGLGSKVPIKDGPVLLDLSQMNHIVEYNCEGGYVVIEPGVTFAQISEYLKNNGAQHFLSVTGGSPHSSVLANTLERGDGLGPLGDRSNTISSLEVVLPNGEIFTTGFSAIGANKVGHLTRDSLGPSLDGLFLQSNLGIVTRMTVWLKRVPPVFATVLFTVATQEKLKAVADVIRTLQGTDVIHGNSCALWNMYKVLASSGQHPHLAARTTIKALQPNQLDAFLPKPFRGASWFGTVAVYGASASHLKAHLAMLRSTLKPLTLKYITITPFVASMISLCKPFLPNSLRTEMHRWLETFYTNSVYRGNPSELSIRSLYWRTKINNVDSIEPNRDRCGLQWVCHALPFSGDDISTAEKIVRKIALDFNFDPNVAFLNVSERYVRMFTALMYDREIPGEDKRADDFQRVMHAELKKAGYPPFRLGIQSMELEDSCESGYQNLLRALKQHSDPSDILAPGRYDFRN